MLAMAWPAAPRSGSPLKHITLRSPVTLLVVQQVFQATCASPPRFSGVSESCEGMCFQSPAGHPTTKLSKQHKDLPSQALRRSNQEKTKRLSGGSQSLSRNIFRPLGLTSNIYKGLLFKNHLATAKNSNNTVESYQREFLENPDNIGKHDPFTMLFLFSHERKQSLKETCKKNHCFLYIICVCFLKPKERNVNTTPPPKKKKQKLKQNPKKSAAANSPPSRAQEAHDFAMSFFAATQVHLLFDCCW